MTTPATPHKPHTPIRRVILIGVGLAAVVSLIVIAFLWPTVTSSAKNLPVAIVGDSAAASQLENALEEQSPGTFELTEAGDRAEAVDLIESRAVYGAIIVGQSPEVLIASAGSSVAAQILTSLAPALQEQLNAAMAAQGTTLAEPIVVKTTDIVPLAESDPRGAGLASAAFPLLLGGMLGGILTSVIVVGIRRRVIGVVLYAAVGGLSLAGIMQGWFGALQGDYLANAAAISLALLSISAVIVGFMSLFGPAGIAVGPLVFMLFANPISSANQPVEFLPEPWGALGQWFPPGASATLLRDLSYFPAAPATFSWLVLAGFAALGILLAFLGNLRVRRTSKGVELVEAQEL